MLLALVVVAASPAFAQEAGSQHPANPRGSSPDGPAATPAPGNSPDPSIKNLVDPGQGGVAGTGLGKVPPGFKTGSGQSVKGPPGQGTEPKAP